MKPKIPILMTLSFIMLMTSCNVEPTPIKVGADACSFCKMSVVDKRFGAELITKKGKIFKFDDLHCLLAFAKDEVVKNVDISHMYLIDYEEPHGFIELEKAFLFKSEAFRSPMGSDIAAFLTEEKLKEATKTLQGNVLQLNTLMPVRQ